MIQDVPQEDFERLVVERSRQVPVVVDFWAEWCGPCRQLGPALEQAVREREGGVELAKVDVDQSQALAQAFGVRGIPAVKAFRDAKVVDEFTGAIPPPKIAEFLDRLVPNPADELAASGDEQSLRRALELDPTHAEAAVALGRILLGRGDLEGARELLEPLAEKSFSAAGLAARAELMTGDPEGNGDEPVAGLLERLDGPDHEPALDALQEELAATFDSRRRELLRRVIVGSLSELDPADPLGRRQRRRLSLALG